ncbi:hypothetical protein PSEUBRA_003642 [Kalmanozyma brasiliensis GHG001]|uniref:uncharacterized protein n=1 Tax=Kalmanozyma brasiliensis (strain GHG001) TaxID=1365824 RepID=UPI002867B5CD|nr:uncharacterized protein PSEUBRA_003642 [Kalmanozyma brasiliensis GHG001]KAF6767270.1 hypothetical protein PSEUBRA_003642 [Kalmanozyma brasiliensis GHG001]
MGRIVNIDGSRPTPSTPQVGRNPTHYEMVGMIMRDMHNDGLAARIAKDCRAPGATEMLQSVMWDIANNRVTQPVTHVRSERVVFDPAIVEEDGLHISASVGCEPNQEAELFTGLLSIDGFHSVELVNCNEV